MMSHAIESVACQTSQLEDKVLYAFVYCDFRDPDTQNITNILGAILSQMCTQLQYFPKELVAAYQSSTERGNGDCPAIEAISEAIQILSIRRRTYIFIDGIDEAGNYRSLAKHLVFLSGSASCVNILATSRNDVAIQRVFAGGVRRVCLEHHTVEIDEDIKQYILSRLNTDEDLTWLSPSIQTLVTNSLLSKSKGT
ncbi:hypothetical protein QQX98_008599 [Neonectria punicea]|uniref:Nephrocystin 3-like N-terminal domain-containing protein n=1 Tax=Neonectria punicea TaxID=979145 RepID=A0ABR1GVT3_9HYPO